MGDLTGTLDGWDRANLVYFVVLLAVFVLLIGSRWRRGRIGRGFTMLAIWGAIIVVVALMFALGGKSGSGNLFASLDPSRPVAIGSAVTIERSVDGHFHVRADIDGKSVRFLIDSGATGILISRDTAARLGFERTRSTSMACRRQLADRCRSHR